MTCSSRSRFEAFEDFVLDKKLADSRPGRWKPGKEDTLMVEVKGLTEVTVEDLWKEVNPPNCLIINVTEGDNVAS